MATLYYNNINLIETKGQQSGRLLHTHPSSSRSRPEKEAWATAHVSSLVVHFLWIPSHIGLLANDTADRLARTSCDLDLPTAAATTASILCYKKIVRQDARSHTRHRSNAESNSSVSIQHYEHFHPRTHKY